MKKKRIKKAHMVSYEREACIDRLLTSLGKQERAKKLLAAVIE